jgi:predicted transcriptional regulator
MGAYRMKSIIIIPDNVKLLEPRQVLTLSPTDKDRYYEKVILDILQANPAGVTVGELEENIKFLAKTIRAHLKRLVARGEVITITRGNLVIYQPNGQAMGKPVLIESKTKSGTVYAVNRIKDAFGNLSYYIQEKELDEYRTLRVKGGINIGYGDMRNFVTELHTISLKDIQGRES